MIESPLRIVRLCSVFEAPDDPGGPSAAFDPVGGMQVHTSGLTRALDGRGFRQTVVTTRPPTTPRLQKLGGARVVRLGIRMPRFRQLYGLPASALVPRLARRADLVHVHVGEDLVALPIALAASRVAADRPLVVTVHCSLRHTLRVVDARTAVLRAVGGWIEERGLRAADAIIVLSHRVARLLAGGGVDPSTIHVIPPGIDRDRFTTRGPDPFPGVPRPRILFVGRLHLAKGVDAAVKAIGRLRTEGAHLVLVGDGPERRSLERTAAARGLGDRVHFTGFLKPDRIPAALSHGDVLVVPSIYEELGRVILEGMHAGIPIVATTAGGIPEVLRDGANGLLVEPGDVDGLARAIDAVLSRPDLAARLREAARRDLAPYDADAVVDRVIEAYREAMLRRGRPFPLPQVSPSTSEEFLPGPETGDGSVAIGGSNVPTPFDGRSDPFSSVDTSAR